MKKMLDRNLKPLNPGNHVEVKYCCGPYGQTRTVRGRLVETDEYGGIYITLDEGEHFHEYGRFPKSFKGGDQYYICNAFNYEHEHDARVGRGEHVDYEHGHTYYCQIIEEEETSHENETT